MISFLNDYNQIAHPNILDALSKMNNKNYIGYGLDNITTRVTKRIKNHFEKDVDVHFMVGGTSCNKIIISHSLKPYESVIAVKTGHINVHETGAIENAGHKINLIEGFNGKVTIKEIDDVLAKHIDEHMVVPKMVYISNSTEIGTIYTKNELKEIYNFCKERNLYLYMDGARLGVALTANNNDLTLKDIANYTDVFYIGGTKNGALFGEAIVIVNNTLKPKFRYSIKQRGGMLAKGFIISQQFETLFTNNLFIRIAEDANKAAKVLVKGLQEQQIVFLYPPETNQIFISIPSCFIDILKEKYLFELWEKQRTYTTIRLVTTWATKESDIQSLLDDLKTLYKKG